MVGTFLLQISASQLDDPDLGLLRNNRGLSLMRAIPQGYGNPLSQSFLHAFIDHVPDDVDSPTDAQNRTPI
jgi:hypothetical protein